MTSLNEAAQNVPASAVMSLRRPLLISVAVGIVALVVSVLLHHIPMGILGCVGLGLGLFNSRMLQRDVLNVISRENPTKKAVGILSARRLLFITAIAVALGIFVRPDGLGVFFGLAVYQFINIAHTAMPVLKERRQQ
ncbi:MAG TPA: ATP synthase subunit I [Pseudonocardiaceae bacterium]|nr:ATP synthase subunit I [Pseudonocardiaceae bacterium]